MKKDYLDELIEELNQLKSKKKTVEFPLPPTPGEVFEVFARVSENHRISADIIKASFAFREPSKSEMEMLEQLERLDNEESDT